jgi:hypothetical protein
MSAFLELWHVYNSSFKSHKRIALMGLESIEQRCIQKQMWSLGSSVECSRWEVLCVMQCKKLSSV